MPLVGINSRYCYKEHILSDGTTFSSFNDCVKNRVKAVIFRIVVVWVLALCSKFL